MACSCDELKSKLADLLERYKARGRQMDLLLQKHAHSSNAYTYQSHDGRTVDLSAMVETAGSDATAALAREKGRVHELRRCLGSLRQAGYSSEEILGLVSGLLSGRSVASFV